MPSRRSSTCHAAAGGSAGRFHPDTGERGHPTRGRPAGIERVRRTRGVTLEPRGLIGRSKTCPPRRTRYQKTLAQRHSRRRPPPPARRRSPQTLDRCGLQEQRSAAGQTDDELEPGANLNPRTLPVRCNARLGRRRLRRAPRRQRDDFSAGFTLTTPRFFRDSVDVVVKLGTQLVLDAADGLGWVRCHLRSPSVVQGCRWSAVHNPPVGRCRRSYSEGVD